MLRAVAVGVVLVGGCWSSARPSASSRRGRPRPRSPHSRNRRPLLEQLDLSRAAMFLRGPEQALREAYAAIGRQPALVE